MDFFWQIFLTNLMAQRTLYSFVENLCIPNPLGKAIIA